MRRVLAVSNIKGGVGKTTSAVNLAASLGELGDRCLVVDLDAQGAASRALGEEGRGANLLDCLKYRDPIDKQVLSTQYPNVDLLPAGENLSRAEGELHSRLGSDSRLKVCMERSEGDWDWVFFDCPAGICLMTINALVAATGVLLPTDAQPMSLAALPEFLNTIHEIRDGRLNPDLEVVAVLPARCQPRRKAHQRGLDSLNDSFPGRVGPVIRENVALVEAPRKGEPVIRYAPDSNGAKDYRSAAVWLRGLLAR